MDNNIPNPCNKIITSKNNKMETIPKNNVDTKNKKLRYYFNMYKIFHDMEWKDPKAIWKQC